MHECDLQQAMSCFVCLANDYVPARTDNMLMLSVLFTGKFFYGCNIGSIKV